MQAPPGKCKCSQSMTWRRCRSVMVCSHVFSASVCDVMGDVCLLGGLSSAPTLCVHVCTAQLSKCSQRGRDPSAWLKANTTPSLLLSFCLTRFHTHSHFSSPPANATSIVFLPHAGVSDFFTFFLPFWDTHTVTSVLSACWLWHMYILHNWQRRKPNTKSAAWIMSLHRTYWCDLLFQTSCWMQMPQLELRSTIYTFHHQEQVNMASKGLPAANDFCPLKWKSLRSPLAVKTERQRCIIILIIKRQRQ